MIRKAMMWGVSVFLLGHFNLGCTEKENPGTAAHVDSATPSSVEPTAATTGEEPSPMEPEASVTASASYSGSGGSTAQTSVDSVGLESGGAGASSEMTIPPTPSVDAGPPEPRCCVLGVVYPDCEDPATVIEKLCERYERFAGDSRLVYHREGNCSYFETRLGGGTVNGTLFYWDADEFVGCWGGIEQSAWSWIPPGVESKYAECRSQSAPPPCVFCGGTGLPDSVPDGEQVCTPEEAYPFTPRLAPDFTPLLAPDGGMLISADASVE